MSGAKRHPIRFAFRLALFALGVAGAAGDFLLVVVLTGRARQPRARAVWMQRWARNYGRYLFDLRVEVRGTPPKAGFLASNHLSYLDILALGSVQPAVFVSKADVKTWPVLGWLTRQAGTIYLKREQRSDIVRVSREFSPAIEAKLPVVLFLEGTSTAGHRVLPFRPSLLEPAVVNNWPVTPVWIGYSIAEGSVPDEVAYWGEMTLAPHLLNLLSQANLTAHVAFGETLPAGLDRKEMARRLRAQVCELAGQFGRKVTGEDTAAPLLEKSTD